MLKRYSGLYAEGRVFAKRKISPKRGVAESSDDFSIDYDCG
jgi:hypothetical protein